MNRFLLAWLLAASLALGDSFAPVPNKIVGPSGSQISIANGNAVIQPSSGGSVNVVTGTMYVPTVIDFSTSVSPTVSGAGHASLVFNGTNMLISVGGASYVTFGGSAWGGITGTISAQTDLQSALDAKLAISTLGTGVATFLATPSGANLASALTTALPATKGGTGLTALGTGIATALGVNTGSAGAPVLFNGVGGTPSSINLSNGTALPNASVTGLGALATVTPGTGVAAAAAIAVNTTGGPLTHGGAGAHTTLTATSLNGNTFTTGTYTLTGTAGKTLTFSNTLTLAGTDSSTLNIGAGGTLGTGAFATAFNPAVPGAIGGTTPAAGSFTTLGATTSISLNSVSLASFSGNIVTVGAGQCKITFDSDITTRIFANNSEMFAARGNLGYIDIAQLRCTGYLRCTSAGTGLELKSGTGARAGNAVLAGGTVTVTNTTVTANSIIYCGRKTAGGTLGQSLSYTVSAGTSFTITSVDATGVLSALDTSTVSFIIVELN